MAKKEALKRIHKHVKHHISKDKELLIILGIFTFFIFVLPLLLNKGATGNAGIDVLRASTSGGSDLVILAGIIASMSFFAIAALKK